MHRVANSNTRLQGYTKHHFSTIYVRVFSCVVFRTASYLWYFMSIPSCTFYLVVQLYMLSVTFSVLKEREGVGVSRRNETDMNVFSL